MPIVNRRGGPLLPTDGDAGAGPNRGQHTDPAFEPPRPTWKRSHKGNLWRRWGGLTVTVFKNKDDLYAWCIAGSKADGRPRFSRCHWVTEDEAVEAVLNVLEGR
jgi:hypothetical protein